MNRDASSVRASCERELKVPSAIAGHHREFSVDLFRKPLRDRQPKPEPRRSAVRLALPADERPEYRVRFGVRHARAVVPNAQNNLRIIRINNDMHPSVAR